MWALEAQGLGYGGNFIQVNENTPAVIDTGSSHF